MTKHGRSRIYYLKGFGQVIVGSMMLVLPFEYYNQLWLWLMQWMNVKTAELVLKWTVGLMSSFGLLLIGLAIHPIIVWFVNRVDK